jgi:hypothetical protein
MENKQDTVMARRDDKQIQIRNSTNDFLVFSKENGGDGVDVLVADENVWLTQKSLCALYDASKSTISEHLTNIFASAELDEDSVVRKFRTTAADGKTYNYKYYNLQAIIAVGFKVNSEKAVLFRAWAADVLAEFALKGYVLDNGLCCAFFNCLFTPKRQIEIYDCGCYTTKYERRYEHCNAGPFAAERRRRI